MIEYANLPVNRGLITLAGTLAVVLLAFTGVGCAEDACKRYADFEVKCRDWPDDETEITRQLAEGFCRASKQGGHMGSEETELVEETLREVECARTSNNCPDYNACKERRP